MSFTVTLPKVLININQAWNNAIQRSSYIAETGALNAQLNRQTAQIGPIIIGSGDKAKQITRTIYWQDACNPSVVDCTDECTAASATLTDNSKDVTISSCKETGFKVSWKAGRGTPHDINDSVALGFLSNMKALDEYLTARYIAFLEANLGTHEYQDIPVGALSSNVWEVPNSNWDEDLIPQFMLSAKFSRFGMPYILNGTNFFAAYNKASAMTGNLNEAGKQNLYDRFNMVFDPINIEANAPNKTYVINSSAVALVTGNYFSPTQQVFAGQHRMYTIASKNLPGVNYDVHELETCTSDDMVISYKIKANFDFFLNPIGCTSGRKGILAFKRLPGA